MPNVIRNRAQQQPKVAVAVAGQLEPVDPTYNANRTPSPVSSSNQIPSEPTRWKAPIVYRGQRTVGMRYLWAHGGVRQPISPLGTGPDIGNAVWSSSFQPELVGPIHDAGFNDKLYESGYPGFNLGLSFKVPQNPSTGLGGGTGVGPGPDIRMRSPNVTLKIQQLLTGRGIISTTG